MDRVEITRIQSSGADCNGLDLSSRMAGGGGGVDLSKNGLDLSSGRFLYFVTVPYLEKESNDSINQKLWKIKG